MRPRVTSLRLEQLEKVLERIGEIDMDAQKKADDASAAAEAYQALSEQAEQYQTAIEKINEQHSTAEDDNKFLQQRNALEKNHNEILEQREKLTAQKKDDDTAERTAKEAERAAHAATLRDLELQISVAKAAGNEELAKSLEQEKQRLQLIASGYTATEAQRKLAADLAVKEAEAAKKKADAEERAANARKGQATSINANEFKGAKDIKESRLNPGGSNSSNSSNSSPSQPSQNSQSSQSPSGGAAQQMANAASDAASAGSSLEKSTQNIMAAAAKFAQIEGGNAAKIEALASRLDDFAEKLHALSTQT